MVVLQGSIRYISRCKTNAANALELFARSDARMLRWRRVRHGGTWPRIPL